MLTWTSRAKSRVDAMMSLFATGRKSPVRLGLRIAVRPEESDWVYRVVVEHRPVDGDFVLEQEGFDVFVDANSMPLLVGARVDFVQEGNRADFRFDNPNRPEPLTNPSSPREGETPVC